MKKRHFIKKLDALAFIDKMGLHKNQFTLHHGGTVWVVIIK
jgi:hypothetical protein